MKAHAIPRLEGTAFAIVGVRGSGKTNTATVIVEQLLDAGAQVVVVDPVDVWWGLRTWAVGKRPGYAIPIIGGNRADVPIREIDGAPLADVVAEQSLSCVLVTRDLSLSAQRRFLTDFAERLYQRKGETALRTPMTLVVEEASLVVPQRVGPSEARMVGAFQRLVRQGRAYGIGVGLIDQRAATINKDVLTQAETLIVHKLTSPHDRKALQAWIEAHDAEGREKEFMASLASLPCGTGWVWSPGSDLFERRAFPKRSTFDSSATPKQGMIVAPAVALPFSQAVEALKEGLAAAVAEKKANDPDALKKALSKAQAETERLTRENQRLLEKQALGRPAEIRPITLTEEEHRLLLDLREGFARTSLALASVDGSLSAILHRAGLPPIESFRGILKPKAVKPPTTSGALGRCERAILTVLAQHGPSEKAKLAACSGYSVSSGGFANALGSLRTQGFIDRNSPIDLTDAGRAALGEWEPLPTGADLLQIWKGKLGKCEREILSILWGADSAMTKIQLAGLTGYSASSGGFANALGSLRTLELITRGQSIELSAHLKEARDG